MASNVQDVWNQLLYSASYEVPGSKGLDRMPAHGLEIEVEAPYRGEACSQAELETAKRR